ncbi:AAA-like domain protein [compost metagenome]
MEITFGMDFFGAKEGRKTPVKMVSSRLINGHVLIVGSSGVGKSYTIRRMIEQAAATGKRIRFHVFDVHGDLEIKGASVVQFSEQAPFGLNPFRVNPSVEFGGVRKAIQAFIRTVDQASRTPLGLKQEAVIRELALDVYREFGFLQNDPSTWSLNGFDSRLVSGGGDNRIYLDVPFADKDRARAAGARWSPEQKLWFVHTQHYKGAVTEFRPAYKARTYPTVADVLAYAKQIHLEKFLGSDQKALRALATVNKTARVMQRRMLDSVKRKRNDEVVYDEDAEMSLEDARQRAIEAYSDYVNAVQTGLELENFTKYESPEVLKSVVDRLGNLNATGIFKDSPAPFDESNPVWRYKLNALSLEEKKMLVLFLLQDLFYKAVQRGEQSDVVEVAILDELGTYTSSQDERGDGIIGTIAREARKFGLALWAANQSPENVPDSLISSVGTKIVLGLDEMYWKEAVSKLRMDTKLLSFIQPHHTMAVQLKEKGALKTRWWWTQI